MEWDLLSLLETYPASDKFSELDNFLRTPSDTVVTNDTIDLGVNENVIPSKNECEYQYDAEYLPEVQQYDEPELCPRIPEPEPPTSPPVTETHSHGESTSCSETKITPKSNAKYKPKKSKARQHNLNNPESEEDEKLKIERKKEYVNAACRRSRAKRKLEREQEIKRNHELELERAQFQLKISELQGTIQSLKDSQASANKIDLQTENLLLRAEIKRHKTLVDHLKTITSRETAHTNVEKHIIASQAARSSIGQILGLCYTSMVDKTWHYRKSNFSGHFFENLGVEIRYQFLPYGANKENAKWVNYRVDYLGIPIEHKLLDEALLPFAANRENIADSWLSGKDFWELRDEKFTRDVETKVVDFDPIDPELVDEETINKVLKPRLVQYREILREKETGNTACIIESILTQSHSQEMVNKLGFVHENENDETFTRREGGNEQMQTIPASCYITVSASPKLVPLVASTEPSPGVRRIEAGIYKGGIITPGEETGTSNITTIVSTPITESEFFMSDRNWVTEFTEDGVPACCIVGIQIIDKLLYAGQA